MNIYYIEWDEGKDYKDPNDDGIRWGYWIAETRGKARYLCLRSQRWGWSGISLDDFAAIQTCRITHKNVDRLSGELSCYDPLVYDDSEFD